MVLRQRAVPQMSRFGEIASVDDATRGGEERGEVLPRLLGSLHEGLRPAGGLFAAEAAADAPEPQVETRLIQERRFDVVERRRSPAELAEAFGSAGFAVDVTSCDRVVHLLANTHVGPPEPLRPSGGDATDAGQGRDRLPTTSSAVLPLAVGGSVPAGPSRNGFRGGRSHATTVAL